MSKAVVHVVDDDADLAASVARLLRHAGYAAEGSADPEVVLRDYVPTGARCIVTDVMMNGLDGFGFADRIRALDPAAAILFMTAWPTTSHAVDAVRRYGGLDYLEKPIDSERLLRSVAEGVAWSRQRRSQLMRVAELTPREREVFDLLVEGLSTKAVAARLQISPRTIDDHRARISAKTGATTLAQLIALAKG